MVEQGRSPSPEDRKPFTKKDGEDIADAVEKWYAQPAPLSPPVAEQKEIEEQENQSPITQPEVSQLVEAAVQGISGAGSQEAQDKKLNETVGALRAEDKILKFLADREPDYAGDMAEEIRTDPLGFGLINSDVRLLPNDAEGLIQRREAFSFHSKLVHRVNEAMQEGREFTRDDMLDLYEQQKNREGEFKDYSDKYEAYSIKHGMGSFDFNMENVFAASERHVLAGHLQKNEKERVNIMQPATIAAHDLIESALPQLQPIPIPNE